MQSYTHSSVYGRWCKVAATVRAAALTRLGRRAPDSFHSPIVPLHQPTDPPLTKVVDSREPKKSHQSGRTTTGPFGPRQNPRRAESQHHSFYRNVVQSWLLQAGVCVCVCVSIGVHRACLGGLEVSGVHQVTGTHNTHSLDARRHRIRHRGAETRINGSFRRKRWIQLLMMGLNSTGPGN